MARSPIPDPLKRRHRIEADESAAQSLATAEAYLEEGRVLEALAFLVKAEAGERLTELRRQAVEEGDAFLLRAVAAAERTPPERGEWASLAAAAEAGGKERYAVEARRHASRGEE